SAAGRRVGPSAWEHLPEPCRRVATWPPAPGRHNPCPCRPERYAGKVMPQAFSCKSPRAWRDRFLEALGTRRRAGSSMIVYSIDRRRLKKNRDLMWPTEPLLAIDRQSRGHDGRQGKPANHWKTSWVHL